MKKIAAVVIMSLVLPYGVQAQQVEDAWKGYVTESDPQEDKTLWCKPLELPPAAWALITLESREAQCKALEKTYRQPATLVPQVGSTYYSSEQPKIRSGTLAWVGLISAIAGAITAFPQGETVRVLDDSYCVNTDTSFYQTASVDYGACSKGPMARKVGALMIIAGVPMMIFGLQSVTASPMITPTAKGVVGSIQWGR